MRVEPLNTVSESAEATPTTDGPAAPVPSGWVVAAPIAAGPVTMPCLVAVRVTPALLPGGTDNSVIWRVSATPRVSTHSDPLAPTAGTRSDDTRAGRVA